MNTSDQLFDRFNKEISDVEMSKLIKVPAKSLRNLNTYTPDAAALAVENALKDIVLPTAQLLEVIRKLIAFAHTYTKLAYPDEKTFLSCIYSNELQESQIHPVCITGLAGVGKTTIIESFHKLFPMPLALEVQNHSSFHLHASWHFRMYGNAGIRQLLAQKLRNPTGTSIKSPLSLAVREAAIQGIALVFADEFQFVSQSDASSSVTKLLMSLSCIGPPLVFVCNYSLANRLWKRPHEERQRLLSNPIVIYPDSASSADWISLVNESLRIAPEFSSIRSNSPAAVLHMYTYGIKRSLALLLRIAYVHMRRCNRNKVEISDLETAYVSQEYASTKRDVENLVRGDFRSSDLKSDLSCPFGDRKDSSASSDKVSNHPSIEAHQKRVANEVIRSVMTPDEREMLGLVDGKKAENSESCPKDRQTRPPVTANSLLGGAERFASRPKASVRQKP